MNWSFFARGEVMIFEVIILPLLFLELFMLRRSQRRDRAAQQASEERARHAEGEHRLDQ